MQKVPLRQEQGSSMKQNEGEETYVEDSVQGVVFGFPEVIHFRKGLFPAIHRLGVVVSIGLVMICIMNSNPVSPLYYIPCIARQANGHLSP